jgi:hypothetical protein
MLQWKIGFGFCFGLTDQGQIKELET